MIDTQLETFTAAEAVKAGLIDAVNRGEVKISGTYELTPRDLTFEQNNFVFKDSSGFLRVGNFTDAAELMKFWEMCGFKIK